MFVRFILYCFCSTYLGTTEISKVPAQPFTYTKPVTPTTPTIQIPQLKEHASNQTIPHVSKPSKAHNIFASLLGRRDELQATTIVAIAPVNVQPTTPSKTQIQDICDKNPEKEGAEAKGVKRKAKDGKHSNAITKRQPARKRPRVCFLSS